MAAFLRFFTSSSDSPRGGPPSPCSGDVWGSRAAGGARQLWAGGSRRTRGVPLRMAMEGEAGGVSFVLPGGVKP